MRKRVLIGGAVSLLAALAFAAPSQAAFKANCIYTGTAKVQDKVLPIGQRLFGGGGTYTLAGLSLSCLTLPGGKVPAGQVYNIVAVSNGKYSNVVCGTFTMASATGQTTVGTITGGAPSQYTKIRNLFAALRYKIQLTADNGTFHLNNDIDSANPDKNLPKPNENLEDPSKPISSDASLYLAGSAHVTEAALPGKPPSFPNAGLGECRKAFQVSGMIKVYKQ